MDFLAKFEALEQSHLLNVHLLQKPCIRHTLTLEEMGYSTQRPWAPEKKDSLLTIIGWVNLDLDLEWCASLSSRNHLGLHCISSSAPLEKEPSRESFQRPIFVILDP